MEQSHRSVWKIELDGMATRVNGACPVLAFVPPTSRQLPWSMPRRFNAWATRRTITVTDDLLDADPCVRRYILAHELGHIVKNHFYLQVGSALPGELSIAFIILSWWHHLSMTMTIYVPVGLLITAALAIHLYLTPFLEYQADKVLVALLGISEAMRGCTEVGRISGSLDNVRRKRLLRMKEESQQ